METRALVYRNWDDLVFDNRNQAYGAYLIRQAYTRRLLISFGVSVAMAALLLLLPIFLRTNTGPVIPTVILKPRIIELSEYVRPVVPRPTTPPADPPSTQVQRTNTTIRVVTDVVPPVVEAESPAPSDPNGVEGSQGVDNVNVSGTSIPAEPIPVVNSGPVIVAEIMPEYEGGMAGLMNFITRKLRYPASARRMNIDGTVYVSFVVNGDGSVTDVKVLRGIHRDCDAEAARVISMLSKWKGGRQGGHPVAVRMVMPIKFSLQEL